MTQQFHTDGSPSKRYAAPARLLLLVVGIAVLNYWMAWSTWSIVGMFLFGLVLVIFSTTVRRAWGDSLAILSDQIIVYKQGASEQRIALSDITRLTVKPRSIAVIWNQEGKKKFIVVGSEHFSDSTWKQLSDALGPFRRSQ